MRILTASSLSCMVVLFLASWVPFQSTGRMPRPIGQRRLRESSTNCRWNRATSNVSRSALSPRNTT